jgi:hypothetical protein
VEAVKDFLFFYPIMTFQNFMVTMSFRYIADRNVGVAVGIDALFFAINFWMARRIAQKANGSPWAQYFGYLLGGISGVWAGMMVTRA